MVEVICEPLPGAGATDPFLQTVRLRDGDAAVGQARWMSGCDPADGTVQILELMIAPSHRRRGHGRRLMNALTEQCREHFRLRQSRLRRQWLAVQQKRQVIARGFLMQFTFHHVGTIEELLREEDVLIYMRSFD